MANGDRRRVDLIRERLTALFTVGDDEAVALRDVPREIPDTGIVVRSDFSASDSGDSAEARVESWLATPNPAFRYRCPGDYLESGDPGKLERLEAVIGSLEDGALS